MRRSPETASYGRSETATSRGLVANLLWLQGSACSGNTKSFLDAEEPSACDLVIDFGINILWHPSRGVVLGDNLQKILKECISGKIPRNIFVFEGRVVIARFVGMRSRLGVVRRRIARRHRNRFIEGLAFGDSRQRSEQ